MLVHKDGRGLFDRAAWQGARKLDFCPLATHETCAEVAPPLTFNPKFAGIPAWPPIYGLIMVFKDCRAFIAW